MSELLIKVDGVSKKFCKDLKRSLWYGMQDIGRSLLGRKPLEDLRKDEFWAVRNVSFELKRGECLGLIGHNGAGKSTLLKMLNGLIRPDEGSIEMHGKVSALIELGAGFNPILTGRENIYNNGSVLGFSKKEIAAKFEAIVDFAEIHDFINTPVQNYSSGMKVRLGFAVAAQMEPDILIIDEVLAVGDVGFRIKCLNAINTLMQKAAVIFVSHSMPQVAKISTFVMHMADGGAKYFGENIKRGIEKYYSEFEGGELQIIENGLQLKKFKAGYESDIWMKVDQKKNKIVQKYLHDLNFTFDLIAEKPISNIGVVIRFFDRSLISVATCQNWIEYQQSLLRILIPKIQFGAGTYDMDIYFLEYDNQNRERILAHYKNFACISIEESIVTNHSSFQLDSKIYY